MSTLTNVAHNTIKIIINQRNQTQTRKVTQYKHQTSRNNQIKIQLPITKQTKL